MYLSPYLAFLAIGFILLFGSPDLVINATNFGCTTNTLNIYDGGPIITSDGMADLYINGPSREYIEQELLHPLYAGITYRISFDARMSTLLCRSSEAQVAFTQGPLTNYATINPLNLPNGSSMLLTTPIISQGAVQTYTMDFTPTIDCLDHIIIGTFVADTNLTITQGNCPQSTVSGLMMIDNVRLFPVNNLDATIDNICNTSGGGITINSGCLNNITFPPPHTFLWNNGNTTNSISNVPSGTYTVTVTASNSNTITSSYSILSLGVNLTPPQIIGPHDACNPNHLFSVDNPLQGHNYSWQANGNGTTIFGSGTTANINFNVAPFNGSGTITFTIHDVSSCCTASSIFEIFACCDGTFNIQNTSITDLLTTNPGIFNLSGPHPQIDEASVGGFGSTISISGTLTVDQDFEFGKIDVLMSPDAVIHVVNNGTDFFLSDAHIMTCNHEYMWRSI
ncbi:MAG: hypothetical protein IPO27_00095 [Bacteroidetes bacterium]|nr:hypothetical protein [Bacteroidota bacterium]